MGREILLNAKTLEGFAGSFLSPRYDNPVSTPQFHRWGWELYTSLYPQCMVIAPRDHAKSTAFTFDFILAEALFRVSSYIVLIGSTEENAAEQMSNIIEEIRENDDLRNEFGISKIERDSQTDLIVRMDDGHRWRVLARGSEQKIRGKMWNGKRPDLIVCDDMEDDEQVENKERRAKFRRWFFRAVKQALSRHGRIRVHGTILHDDSLLARLMKNSTWRHQFYKAHRSYSEFEDILWPAAWSAERLRNRQLEFQEDRDPGGYSQEFLNTPLDNEEAYLKKDDFLEMRPEDYESDKVVCAAADFAVSRMDSANRTSFTVGGKDLANNLCFLDQRTGRWDASQWIEVMFDLQRRWRPDIFWVEGGQIWNAVKAIIYKEMQEKGLYINIEVVNPIKDKASRGRAYQRRHRAGSCRYDKRASWYPDFEHENLRFTGHAQSALDDQFDSAALLALGFEGMANVEPEEFFDEEQWEQERGFWNRPRGREGLSPDGRSNVTGY